jgi:HAD superfamily hydrolase (TIGR01484 family)
MNPKAVAFDLDSTLAESKSPVTKEMGLLLSRLAATRPIAVMSGGKYGQFQTQVLSAFPEDMNLSNVYFFPNCAGYCYHYQDGAWTMLDDHSLTEEEQQQVLHALEVSMKETGFDIPPEHVWGERIEFRGSSFAFSALGQEAPADVKKGWDPDKEKRRPLFTLLTERLPNFEVKMNAMTTIDITRRGISKALGVRRFSEITGVPVADMLYIGDALFPGGNDEVVKETGIETYQTSGPAETAELIQRLITS